MTQGIPDSELLDLIIRARSGDEEALGIILDQHRDQLRRLAENELNGKLSARVDASDVVQQTFLSVCKKVSQFEGESLREFIAWIYKIHRHNIQDVARQHSGTEKRDVNKEQFTNLKEVPSGHEESTPSQKAMKNEQELQLLDLIQKLPENQREAVRLRHLEGKTIEEMASLLGRSTQAVASLLKRGLENLRKISN